MGSTVRDFLFRADPSIHYAVDRSAGSHAKVENAKRPNVIRKWVDFDLTTLQLMCDGIFLQALDQEFKCKAWSGQTGQRFMNPGNETALNDCLKESVQTSVNYALRQTQEYFRANDLLPQIPSSGISMVTKSRAEYIVGDLTAKGKIDFLNPAWAGCFEESVEEQLNKAESQGIFQLPQTHLPGDTTLRWKTDFNLLNEACKTRGTIDFGKFGLKKASSAILTGRTFQDDGIHVRDDYKGLRCAITQIYTHCYYANCRYGYIINETQLLVVRIRPSSRSGRDSRPLSTNIGESFRQALRDEGILEYRVITFNPKDRTKLSVTLALWWLHLLAAIESDIRWNYPQLASWTLKTLSNESGYLRRNNTEYHLPPEEDDIVEDSTEGRRILKVCGAKMRRQFSERLDSPELHEENRESQIEPELCHQFLPRERILDTPDFEEEPETDLEMIQSSSQHLGLNPDDFDAQFQLYLVRVGDSSSCEGAITTNGTQTKSDSLLEPLGYAMLYDSGMEDVTSPMPNTKLKNHNAKPHAQQHATPEEKGRERKENGSQ